MRLILTVTRPLAPTFRRLCTASNVLFEASDEVTLKEIAPVFKVTQQFVTENEEASLLEEIEPHIKRLRYEGSHWDGAIVGYREVERKTWSEQCQPVLDRVRRISFAPDAKHLPMVHCLDVAKDGEIRPHVDAVRFCGDTLAGLSLMSTAVMKLALEKDPAKWVKILLPRRSLYVMSGTARYDYTHAILGDKESYIHEMHVPRERRISVMFRVEPNDS